MSTIFLVEDDRHISEAIADVLQDHAFQVEVAANGKVALEKLRRAADRPHMILLDLMMPVMDGWQFRAAQLADPALAAIPVVVLSAHVDVEQAASKLGAVGWLKKPVDLKSLLRAVGAS